MKTIGILGSTGSIGTQTLDVVRANGDISVKAIAAGSNIRLLEEQIREFKPEDYYGITLQAGNVRWTWRDGKSGSLRTFKKERAQEIKKECEKHSLIIRKTERDS